MDFYTFLFSLPRERRGAFAAACHTTSGRLMQIAYGNEPASPALCVAIDRESQGAVDYSRVNDAWVQKKSALDQRKRIPMDWRYVEAKAIFKATADFRAASEAE